MAKSSTSFALRYDVASRQGGFRHVVFRRPRKEAVIYPRVSSNEQEKEGFSIPAQIELRALFPIL
jgi:hypothetical protein